MHIFKNWILGFGIKKLAIISTVAVVGVTGTTVGITSMKNSENAVVEEEKIVINTQTDEKKEAEVEKGEEVTEEVANQEVVTEATSEEAETETVKEQPTTNAATSGNSNTGSAATNTNSNSSTTNNTSDSVTDKNSDSTAETPKVEDTTTTEPQYKTITLNQVTTYYEFAGYFTDDFTTSILEIDLVSMGLAENNDNVTRFITEYYNVDTGDFIYFVCNRVGFSPAMFFDYVDEVGRGVVPVKVVNN